jgi:predicted glycosyltransferase
MRFWIDLVNSPHVLFFEPIIKKLRQDGHEVLVTARDFAQTVPLIKQKNIEATIYGKHMGKSIIKKGFGLVRRSLWLVNYGRKFKPDLALSHNSNDLAVAAYVLGVPHLVFVDYEYASFAHRFNLLFVTKIFFPEPVKIDELEKLYGHKGKFGNYPGLKEQVYLPYYNFLSVRKDLGISEDEVLVLVRPPADFALYHRFENPLFEDCLEYLRGSKARVVVLPRTKEQREGLKERFSEFIYLETMVDGPSLIKEADLVVSAGGTMNREAAVLGTPAYTIFAGKIGAVDRYLLELGLLHRVEKPDDIVVVKKNPTESKMLEPTLNSIMEIIYSCAQGSTR